MTFRISIRYAIFVTYCRQKTVLFEAFKSMGLQIVQNYEDV